MLSQKRGQVVYFILVGVLIIAILAFTTQLMKTSAPSTPPFDATPFLQDCVDESLKQGLTYLQFGTIEHGKNTTLPVFYYQQRNYLPNISVFANELAYYVERESTACINSSIAQPHISNMGTPTSVILFTKKGVIVKLELPITITYDDRTITYDSFTAQEQVAFKKLWNYTNQVVQGAVEMQGAVDLSLLSSLDVNHTLTGVPRYGVMIVTFIDGTSRLQNDIYSYSFGVQYDVAE